MPVPPPHLRAGRLATLAFVALSLACGDSAGPPNVEPYDWRLLVPFDSAGAGLQVDSLTFHWPRAMVPVKVWVEDQSGLPGHFTQAIALWRDAFQNGEWNATVVTDSTTADIIVRHLPVLAPATGALRLGATRLSCEGVTEVDTVATRFELRVPVRVRVYPSVPGAPDITECLGAVAAHELGHALGVMQHSPHDDDLMYDVPTATVPSDRDLATARRAYRTPSDLVPVRP